MADRENEPGLDKLKLRVHELEAEVKSFGQKRAYFMDIYKRKEEDVSKLTDELDNVKHVKSRLESELKSIRDQVSDMKTEHMITCISKDEEMDRLKRLHQEELSSLNMSLQDLINESAGKRDLQDKVDKLITANKNLNEELTIVRTSLKGHLQRGQESMRYRGIADNSNSTSQLAECGSASCNKEKRDLRVQLDAAHQRLQRYADQQPIMKDGSADEAEDNHNEKRSKDLFEVVDHEEKLKELEAELKGEKSSRRDLEMYVAVLAKQKDVFQTDIDDVRKELRESLDLLEKERKEHLNLKLTWQMANDQFLESQRLLMIDMKRMGSVLTEEQQRRVEELQRLDEEREAQQQKIDNLERQKQEQIEKIEAEGDLLLGLPGMLKSASSHTSLSSTEVYRDLENVEPVHLVNIEKELSPPSSELVTLDTRDAGSPVPPNVVIGKDVLTDDMTTALVAPQAEDVENKKVLEQFRQSTPDRNSSVMATAGSRVVSEKQWARLQDELQQSRAKLGRPCDMCKNYETDLQKEQRLIQSLEGQLNQSRQNVKEQKKVIDELEEKMKSLAEQCKGQLADMRKVMEQTEEKVYVLTANLDETSQEFGARILSLTKERDDVQKQLLELERENEQLLDMHSSTSQEMIDQQFILPTELTTSNKLLSEFREKLITCKAAKEHIDCKLKEQITLLKDQAIAEEFQWKAKEDILSQEISALRDTNVRLESIQSELDRESKLRADIERKLEEAKTVNESSKRTEEALRTQIHTSMSEQNKEKREKLVLIEKVKTLQSELSNTESVQKDFVKLSQQLQVQLEKIRQAETEVRWEHKADVTQCNSCCTDLPSNKDKHNCMHCGKIHCQQCSSRMVMAGPNHRPTRVCDVCHTILESEATPYFSSRANEASSPS